MEDGGDMKTAENYYLKINDWQSAVNMYRTAEKWNDAFRIAKDYGNDVAQKRVCLMIKKNFPAPTNFFGEFFQKIDGTTKWTLFVLIFRLSFHM